MREHVLGDLVEVRRHSGIIKVRFNSSADQRMMSRAANARSIARISSIRSRISSCWRRMSPLNSFSSSLCACATVRARRRSSPASPFAAPRAIRDLALDQRNEDHLAAGSALECKAALARLFSIRLNSSCARLLYLSRRAVRSLIEILAPERFGQLLDDQTRPDRASAARACAPALRADRSRIGDSGVRKFCT